MEPRIKYREMILQVVLFIVTFGLYAFYWYYVTGRELEQALKREEPVFLWTILLFVPLVQFYSIYKYGELFEGIVPDVDRWAMFVIWISCPIGVWMIVQRKLNKMALA